MKLRLFPVILFVLPFVFASCGSKDEKAGTPEKKEAVKEAPKKREPTKEVFLEDFRALCKLLVDKKYEESLEAVLTPKGMSRTRALEMMPRLLGLMAISNDGIDLLEKVGTWGKAEELFPDTAPDLAKRANAEIKDSWALAALPAQVMGYWNGEKFLFFKFDKVGLIAQDPAVMEEAKKFMQLGKRPVPDAGQK